MISTPLLRLRTPLSLLLALQPTVAQFTSLPRWGQAVSVVNNILLVHGGKTDQFNEFSYTAATTNNDLLLLDLSSAIDPSSPPWQYVGGSENSSTTQGPALAWHTLAAYNTSQLLMLGGDGGPNSPIVLPNQADSAWLLDVYNRLSPSWISEPTSWAGEPSRRIHHAVASTSGKLWIVGGEKDDGSGLGYSDHYVFDPASPSFTQLPSGGPPDIYGHATIVLSNGWLLVLGGYCQSESQLIPFTTIWALDTTQSTLSWSNLSVSSTSLPPPRRAFAAVLLSADKILIHGGGDAELQTSYSDGWILDTSTNPMTWSNISALTSLGPRRDHFAVVIGSQVVFGFGYGINSGAPAALSIYDTNSNSFVTSYTPMTTPSQTTLPAPTGTNAPGQGPTNSNGSPIATGSGARTGTGTGTQTGTKTGVHPTSTTTGNPNDPNDPGNPGSDASGKSPNSKAIALGTLFGFFALVIVLSGAYAYHRRRHTDRRPELFRRLIGSEDMESPASAMGGGFGSGHGEKVRMAGNGWFADGGNRNGWTFWGLGAGRRRAQAGAAGRFDILADEDERDFDVRSLPTVRRDGSGSSRSWYSGTGVHERSGSGGRRPTLGDMIHGSLTSLRSVGAMITSNVGIGSVGNRRGNVNPPEWWEKSDLPLDPFSDEDALYRDEGDSVGLGPMALGGVGGAAAGIAARPRGGQIDSELGGIPYADPFRDQDAEVMYDAGSDGEDDGSQARHGSTSGHLSLPNSSHSTILRSPVLAPLVTVSSRNSASDPATSSSSHEPPSSLFSARNSMRGSSHSSHDPQALSRSPSGRPHTTSIIGAGGGPTQPMKRSDTWWARFRRTSFRDLNGDPAKSPTLKAGFDIRDPNPAPRLTAIQESSAHSNSPESPESRAARRGGSVKRRETRAGGEREMYAGGHEKSMSSLRTAKTADSETIERMGRRMDVVQRDETMSTHQTTPSTASTLPEQNSTWYASDRPLSAVLSSSDRSESTFEVESPTQERDISEESSAESSAAGAAPRAPRAVARRKSSGGAVASRVAEYERRMSQDVISPVNGPTSPTRVAPRDTQTREVEHKKRKSTVAVNYGLVPRPELFVANPDHRSRQPSDP